MLRAPSKAVQLPHHEPGDALEACRAALGLRVAATGRGQARQGPHAAGPLPRPHVSGPLLANGKCQLPKLSLPMRPAMRWRVPGTVGGRCQPLRLITRQCWQTGQVARRQVRPTHSSWLAGGSPLCCEPAVLSSCHAHAQGQGSNRSCTHRPYPSSPWISVPCFQATQQAMPGLSVLQPRAAQPAGARRAPARPRAQPITASLRPRSLLRQVEWNGWVGR